jgi:hypothetical protein
VRGHRAYGLLRYLGGGIEGNSILQTGSSNSVRRTIAAARAAKQAGGPGRSFCCAQNRRRTRPPSRSVLPSSHRVADLPHAAPRAPRAQEPGQIPSSVEPLRCRDRTTVSRQLIWPAGFRRTSFSLVLSHNGTMRGTGKSTKMLF